MPFQDLPHRREDSAPVLNLADPCEIWRYFDDLEFLFLKHRVSDDQEKKRAAVRYPSVADFKAEVIALYPEAIAAQEHTLADLDMLVAHCARTAIRSEIELGAYYCEFLIISRFLIAKSRISAPTQARYLLASFEPRLATAIHARLERRFPDHLPDDPYDTEAIYDAALYVLAWQRSAPFVDPLRDILILSPSSLAPPAPLTFPPPTVHAFPLATESLSPIPSDPCTATHALKQERAASLVPAPRDAALPFTASAETSKPIPTLPPPVQAFPPTLQFVQADAPATVPTSAPKCAAPLISVAARRSAAIRVDTSTARANATAATLDALADVIATLKSGLEAILNAQKSPEVRAPEPEAARSQVEHCKFCRSGTHIEEECEEAEEYILAGMCKRNVFGRLTLPSGAEVPRRIKGKCLRKRFEEYHSQHPGQRAAPAYLEDLARPQTPALQDATSAIPSVMGATSPGAEATALAMSEVPRQPRSPERTLCDPRAASNRRRATEAPGDLRKAIVQSSNAPGVPKSAAQPVPGQSEPERDDTATSRARPWMRESNFAVMAASDRREAPLMVSQRGLFAFVPGIRPEAAHAAASTPAPPKECAVYFAQAAAPQLAHDRAPGRAKPSKCCQAPAPAVETRVSTAPSAHAALPNAHAALPSVCAASPSARDTSRVPRSAHKPACVTPSGSAPSSSCKVSRSVPKPPSIRPNIPERPQAAPRASRTLVAIQSRPRWPRSRLSHRAPAHMRQRAQPPPPVSVLTPSRRPSHLTNPRDRPRRVEPSDRQPMTRRLETAPRSPSRPRAPRRGAPSMRNASATLIQRPCDLRDSGRTYTLPTMHSYVLAEDWGQSIFHQRRAARQHHSRPLPIHCAFLTLSDAHDSDATSARTPAMYAKTLSNHSALYKRLQPAQRRARVPQCNCDDRAICRGSPSHVAMTASEPHSRRLPRRVHTLAMTFYATESVYQSRGGSGARTAQAYQEQPTSSSFKRRLDRERATVARQFRRHLQVQNNTDSQRDKELKRKTSATTTAAPCTRGHARRYPQQRARYSRIDLLNSRAASIKRFTRTRAVATAPFARGLARRVYSWATKDSTRSNVHSNRGDQLQRDAFPTRAATHTKIRAAPKRARPVSDHLRPLSSVPPSQPRRTCARPSPFNTNARATAADPHIKFRAAPTRARLFATTQRSTDLAPLPNLAALVRGTIPSTATRLRPPRTYIRRLAPRGGLRDCLRRFTPPNPAQP
ncbi:hypothetical protein EDB85DRAFT_2152124 [Lactarius pseudohatsudake]|nr:hypothetical protein EDB85DRAFT_2152124 [Lactarius pseudohatsudake]